ncbi:MAG: GNAT family N-acetyltransferase, partial [Kiritimatiellaeota bacterium]|nr:GNAT family N-acetyltransferase [Kiritimatiellota bacterium]
MIFRKTEMRDVDAVIEIIDEAKSFLKSNGVDQWQKGYPNREAIEGDIVNGEGYVLADDDGEVVGTAMVTFDGEKSYESLVGGEWLTHGAYAVVHRIAVSDKTKGRGLAGLMLDEIAKLVRAKNVFSIKIDTHEDNA